MVELLGPGIHRLTDSRDFYGLRTMQKHLQFDLASTAEALRNDVREGPGTMIT